MPALPSIREEVEGGLKDLSLFLPQKEVEGGSKDPSLFLPQKGGSGRRIKGSLFVSTSEGRKWKEDQRIPLCFYLRREEVEGGSKDPSFFLPQKGGSGRRIKGSLFVSTSEGSGRRIKGSLFVSTSEGRKWKGDQRIPLCFYLRREEVEGGSKDPSLFLPQKGGSGRRIKGSLFVSTSEGRKWKEDQRIPLCFYLRREEVEGGSKDPSLFLPQKGGSGRRIKGSLFLYATEVVLIIPKMLGLSLSINEALTF